MNIQTASAVLQQLLAGCTENLSADFIHTLAAYCIRKEYLTFSTVRK